MMARTPIPPDLIHRPEEVERDAARFDHLCRLVEEIAFPIVEAALHRETAEAGIEVLTEEAMIALRLLAEDAEILEELDEKQVLEVQKSLGDEVPWPDEKESLEHTRDFSQVLTSAWLEILRTAESEMKIVILSDYLMPRVPSRETGWLMERFVGNKPNLPQILIDATAWFAVNEIDVATVMATLRAKLFSGPRVVDLPFDLVLAGTARKSPMALSRESLERLRVAMRRYTEHEGQVEEARQRFIENKGQLAEPPPTENYSPPANVGAFATQIAQVAVKALSEPLPAAQYTCLEMVAVPTWEEESIEARVHAALTQ
jgi:hypothetical protein